MICPSCQSEWNRPVKFCPMCGAQIHRTHAEDSQLSHKENPPSDVVLHERLDVPGGSSPSPEIPNPSSHKAPHESSHESLHKSPAHEAPAHEVPADDAPIDDAPAYKSPAHESPAHKSPADDAPAHEPQQKQQQPDEPQHHQQDTSERTQNIFQNFSGHVHRAAGFDGQVEIRLRDLFSETFKKHTEEDAEKLFIVGTSSTTPTMDQLIDTWPKPWLFMRIFIIVAIGYFGFYLGFSLFQNLNLLPGLIMIGSFMVPLSLLVFFWEINAPQNIPIYRIVYFVLIAGLISLIIALFLFQTLGSLGQNVIFVGIIEETAKVLAILWCLRKRNYHFILNGLLVGAAVGTGFAAFESAGYALQGMLTDMNTMMQTIHLRGLLAPGGHIVWAALEGAAICMVKGIQPWRWEMVKDMRFLRIFLITTTLHVLWNSPISGVLFPVSYVILIVISWLIAFAMISVGLKEITTLKNRYIQERRGLSESADLSAEADTASPSSSHYSPHHETITRDG